MLVDVGWVGELRVGIFRSGVFDAVPTGGSAEVKDAVVELEDFSGLAEMVEQAHAVQQGPSIEDADVIVAGGRGLGAPEKFALCEELAGALGGAVAATRAVVDAGLVPVLGSGRADGQDGVAEALRRGRHLRARSSTRWACRVRT